MPVPDGAKTSAVYGEIQNPKEMENSILAVTSNQYKIVEFHTMTTDNEGIMRMRKREFPINLHPKETIKLERNGTHLMLYDREMKEGNLEIQIHFSDGFVMKQIVEKKSL
ncbi:copper chaperone PCu(A)C [Leptospira sp. WS39.C2]